MLFSLGSTKYPKELCHIFCDQSVYYLNNYNSLDIVGSIDHTFKTESIDKGHFEEMEIFIRAIKDNVNWPIPLWQQIQATEIALLIEDCINQV